MFVFATGAITMFPAAAGSTIDAVQTTVWFQVPERRCLRFVPGGRMCSAIGSGSLRRPSGSRTRFVQFGSAVREPHTGAMISSTSTSSEGQGGPLRFFSGDSEDTKDYRRWKIWVQNKLLTLDKLPVTAKASLHIHLAIWKGSGVRRASGALAISGGEGRGCPLGLAGSTLKRNKTDELGDAL